MKTELILLSGATGVGTSKFGIKLADFFNIQNIQETKYIEEIINSVFNSNLNELVSSFYSKDRKDVKRTELIRKYKTRCSTIEVAIEGLVNTYLNKHTPLIIGGTHLLPGKLNESVLLNKYKNELLEYHMYISDLDVHKNRFIQRQKEFPSEYIKQYIDNFKEIREVHDYMLERAKKFKHINFIDNSGSEDNTWNLFLNTLVK